MMFMIWVLGLFLFWKLFLIWFHKTLLYDMLLNSILDIFVLLLLIILLWHLKSLLICWNYLTLLYFCSYWSRSWLSPNSGIRRSYNDWIVSSSIQEMYILLCLIILWYCNYRNLSGLSVVSILIINLLEILDWNEFINIWLRGSILSILR